MNKMKKIIMKETDGKSDHFLDFFSFQSFSSCSVSLTIFQCAFSSTVPKSTSKSMLSKLQELMASKLYFFDSYVATACFLAASSFSIFSHPFQFINMNLIFSYSHYFHNLNRFIILVNYTKNDRLNQQTKLLSFGNNQIGFNDGSNDKRAIQNINSTQPSIFPSFTFIFIFHIFHHHMSKVQYQQKPLTANESAEQTSQPNPERRQYRDRPYNNRSYNDNNNSYNNDHQNNGNYDKKTRYQDKQRGFRNKFGFEYDESKIGYNTEIPEMPEKPKQKPDEVKYNIKVQELQKRELELTKLRKEKKNSYKNGSKSFTEEIQKQKNHIELAKACLVVLNYDKEAIEKDVEDLENKIASHKRKIDSWNKPAQRGAKNLKIEEMAYGDVVREEQRILQEMSTRNLSKAEQVELSNILNKLKKKKIELPKSTERVNASDDKKDDEISFHRNAVQKLKTIKATLADRSVDIDSKIQSIEDDIVDFEQTIEEIHNKMKYTDNSKLLEEAQKLKEQIKSIWDELKELGEQHKAKINDYEYEQQKIKYIQWAKDIKTKKAEEWELEKQQKKRQKLKEKENYKKKEDTKDEKTKQGEKKTGENTAEPQFERKKINKNQKEIDSCAFLIQYCKDLNQGFDKTEQKQGDSTVKLEDALKKGEWAKMKNVQVIKSKKTKDAEEQAEPKNYRKRQNKNPVAQTADRFSHTYFVAQVFDSVKVLPPTKQEEIEKVIIELEDKMEYYLAHPDEGVEKSLVITKEDDKETRGRGPRRIINTEEFPSLK